MMQTDIDRARDALHSIPPDLDRAAWVKAGMAFHACGGDFADFDQWSAGADTYNASAARATWRSFKAAPVGVGAGSLFGMAREHGWTERSASDRPTPAPASPRKPAEPPRKPAPSRGPYEVWERCEPATAEHGYITAKAAAGVPLGGLRVVPAGDPMRIAGAPMAGALVVPCWDGDKLATLQFITTGDTAARLKAAGKPSKLNLPNASVKGWFAVGDLLPGGVVHIVEGIGQAWAVWQATGAAAVVAFGAGNMGKVAAALRQRDATARLVICPDTGKESDAARIAAEHGCAVAAMPEGEPSNFDVWDYAAREGGDALAALLEAATEPPKPEPLLKPVSVFDVLTRPAPPPAFVWDGYLPRGVVALFGAHGGTGKSTIALMLAVATVMGRPLLGVATEQSPAVFVSLEDGAGIVRHRLAGICRAWGIDPLALGGLHIVDGTENPELYAADPRSAGDVTSTYAELARLVQATGAGLVVVDNASDAYGGEENNRRQVRVFMRSLGQVARLTDCAVCLLAHVDKGTSRSGKPEGGEGYSGSTAWHNSARSRLYMTRDQTSLLTLEHQKSNLGRKQEPISLVWPEGGLPMLATDAPDFSALDDRVQGRADDRAAAALLVLLAEFEGRGQYASPAVTSRNHPYALLKSEPAFQRLKLRQDDVKRIVNQCHRAKWIEQLEYRTPDRKPRQRWTVTDSGRVVAGLPSPTAPTAPTPEDGAEQNMAQGGAPTAPTCVGGVGDRARTRDGAEDGTEARA
jgi:putative DNA primase/helicase